MSLYKQAFLELARTNPAQAYDLLERIAMSKEPVSRALERMYDAEKRGGIDGMIKATAARAKATKDAAKREGIIEAIDIVIAHDGHKMSHSQIDALKGVQQSLSTGTLLLGK